ncbi:hypothetical protein DE146DRAFT_723606, partial [Phaeosphaeria sp. MPI-PUGE-AT-0046c]
NVQHISRPLHKCPYGGIFFSSIVVVLRYPFPSLYWLAISLRSLCSVCDAGAALR